MIDLLHKLLDWEAFKKPLSRRFSDEIIRDITYANPVKWRHPILPKGSKRYNELQGLYFPINPNQPFEDIYFYEHADLAYRIEHYPMGTCREGYWCQITAKDAARIQRAFYRTLERRRELLDA